MKIRNFKFILLALLLLHILLSLYYSARLPWGGDEWYTFSNPSIRSTPNFILIKLSRILYGPVSINNYLYYRQIGLFWMLIGLLFLLRMTYSKKDSVNKVAVFHYLFIIFSSFVFFQEQYFRYYGFYLLCSLLCFYVILFFDDKFSLYRKYFYGLLLVSPFLHMFVFWQLFWYILLKEFWIASKRVKIVFSVFLIAAVLPGLLIWKRLIVFFLQHFDPIYAGNSLEFRGLSMGLLFKPIYAVFQFVFGYDIEPTENFYIMGLFGIIGLGFIYRFYRLRSENQHLFKIICLAGLVPFLSMYWVLEALTLPQMTQFESKHALFFLPIFLASFVPARSEKKRNILPYVFPGIVLFCAVWGSIVSLSSPRLDWGKIIKLAEEVQAKDGIIVVDGRAKQDFVFYSDGKILKERVLEIYEVADKKELVTDTSSVFIVTNDWKSYQVLSLEQNWNTGAGTEDRFNAVSRVFKAVRESDKICTGAYGFYPLFAFKYESVLREMQVNQPNPGFFTLPYQDVRLPIQEDGVLVYGWQELGIGYPLLLGNKTAGDLSIYYFIKCKRQIPKGTVIGKIQSDNGSVDLVMGDQGSDGYSSFYSRQLKEAKTWYQWHKRPVVTQSLRYPGSIFPSKGSIYHSEFYVGKNSSIAVTDPDVILNACYIDLVRD